MYVICMHSEKKCVIFSEIHRPYLSAGRYGGSGGMIIPILLTLIDSYTNNNFMLNIYVLRKITE